MTPSDSLAPSHRNGPFSRVGVSTNCSWLQYRQERALSFQTASSVRLPEEKNFFQILLERDKDQFTDSRSQETTLDATLRRLVRTMEPVQARLPFELHIR